MTGLLHERELSRKSFLKAGGALVVGLSASGTAQAYDDPKAASPLHTGLVKGPPDPRQIDTWIAVHADNTASIYTGRVDLGQGSPNGLLMIAGEELDMDLSQLRWIEADSNVTPDTGNTTGSSSITRAGPPVRAGAASAKQALLKLASAALGVPVAGLSVRSGVVSGGGKTVTYGQLIGDKVFNLPTVAATLNPGQSPAKPVSQYALVGTSPPRVDIPDKVTGKFVYIHNVRVPGMLHGRVVRPQGQGGYGTGAKPLSIDEGSIRHIPGARVVRKGDFVGVVAPREYDAIQAASQLKVKWDDTAKLPGSGNLFGAMRAVKTTDVVNVQTGDVGAAFAKAAKVLSASYTYDYQMHGPIGPPAAIAIVKPDNALVMTNTQGVYRLRDQYLADALGMDGRLIRVIYVEGASAFGHCETDDAACAAAVMSQVLGGTPVRVQFMRWDDNGWDNYGPAQLNDVRGAIDAGGKIVAMDYTSWVMPGTNSQETTSEQTRLGPLKSGNGSANTSITNGRQYVIPNRRVTSKSMPLSSSPVLKTAPLRAPGDLQACFAYEQMIDELAYAANMDPVAFRLAQMNDQRWVDILTAATKAANWKPKVAASSLSQETVVTGRGVALAPRSSSLSAVVADVEVNKKTGKIVVKHMYASQDSGLAVYPGGVESQIVGGVIQSVSRSLSEAVTFTRTRVTSIDWVTYPLLRFKDHPAVTAIVVQRPDVLPSGGGEPPAVPTPAAIANAFFDATGVRIRQAPMTPARVRAVLKAAGVS
ncbi:MAG TPA: molybdopterin cofactor-binding domain-containing protein [Gaiellaceae bacterium]|nr:molybdopterin cofactor-binding domain-containing protein [Gaiellaceae bacterium]